MLSINDGQCGTCSHFGGGIDQQQLVQIRINHEADESVTGGCDLPSNASLHLRVSPIGTCDGYAPVEAA